MADIEDIKEFLLGSILQVTYRTKDIDPFLWINYYDLLKCKLIILSILSFPYFWIIF